MFTSRKEASLKNTLRALAAALLCLGFAAYAKPVESPFNYDEFRQIAIMEDARAKPLDTFARESMRLITSREYWKPDKAPHEFLSRDPMTNLISMLFEPEKWKDIPCIYLAHAEVKTLLGVDSKAEWISYNQLKSSQAFREAFRKMVSKQQAEEKMTSMDSNVGDLHSALNRMDGIFIAAELKIVPTVQSDASLAWTSLMDMSSLSDIAAVQTAVEGLMSGFTSSNIETFNASAHTLAQELRKRGGEAYPAVKTLEYEITYNAFKPFRQAWVYLLIGTILFAVSMGLTTLIPYYAAWGFTLVGFLLSSYGLLLRVMIAGRPPVSNMYESVIYMGWGILLFAGIFELVYRQRIFGLCGAAMGVIVLVLADMLPFDPAISPLVPVLRSNYWLLIHVLTIVISYSAFALAMAIAHLALCFYLFTPGRKDLIRTANNFVYRAIQVGVLLLTIGTILGGVWANESWGRFWGWDPKETWAFISIMGYLALLHARYIGYVGPFGISVGAVLGFQLILMTWYGVNFILGTGLHSYGFGAGGQAYIYSYLGAECLFLGMVAARYKLLGDGLKSVIKEA